MISHTTSNWALLCVFISLVGCAESPRAVPGYQAFTQTAAPAAPSPPLVIPAGDQRRRAYEDSLNGRLCYYGQVVDQNNEPVPNALVKITLERLGWNNSSSFRCRTTTDADGKFSVVGGVGTNVYIRIYKAGYTPGGRSGSLRGGTVDLLRATPDAPRAIPVWKNTGFDQSQLIRHDPFPFGKISLLEIQIPLPKQTRFDLVRGVIAKEGEDWDVAMEYTLNDKGEIPREELDKQDGRYLTYYFIRINDGKMAYTNDPLPGFAPTGDGFIYHHQPGVFLNALKAPRLPYLYQADNRVFQFQSRGGKVHGSCAIEGGALGSLNSSVSFRLYALINPTGSPALHEIEPTEKNLSTDGYPLSE